jgi:hypothetical protein
MGAAFDDQALELMKRGGTRQSDAAFRCRPMNDEQLPEGEPLAKNAVCKACPFHFISRLFCHIEDERQVDSEKPIPQFDKAGMLQSGRQTGGNAEIQRPWAESHNFGAAGQPQDARQNGLAAAAIIRALRRISHQSGSIQQDGNSGPGEKAALHYVWRIPTHRFETVA